MIEEYKSDDMTKFLCSLSPENRKKFMSCVCDAKTICGDIMDTPDIEEKEFRKIVRLHAVETDIDEDAMKKYTNEMMKDQKLYEFRFKQSNIITKNDRVSYMCNQSFRPPPPSTHYTCGCGSHLMYTGKTRHDSQKKHTDWVTATARTAAADTAD